ncbi:sigma-70 family RNA polymerase sigma factor [Streptomyces marincola]|nr:sigma-70 family RNA polymerase sigma factor [Streptomyces marincola]
MGVEGEDDDSGGSVVPGRRGAGSGTADLELVERMRRGVPEAYDELYRRHADAVRRYARTCCRDSDTADDLTNEVFAATLQAVRRGAGPETAVRAYLLTSVRRVAADWARSARREHLVEDFAVFAVSAGAAREAGVAAVGSGAGVDVGADVRAMREAERSMAVRAFRSLPERWQTVLWHTAVEEASPREVAPLLGLTPNATAVLAHRAREGLRQAFLQEHVSRALRDGGECARFADRLGAYARGGLRTRAERGLRKHLEECGRCATAASEVRDLNEHIRLVLPLAVIGWFAAEASSRGAGFLLGTAGVGTAGSAAAGGAGGAASEGIGGPVKAGIASGVVATAVAAVLAYALVGGEPAEEPRAGAPPRQVPAGPSVEEPVPEPRRPGPGPAPVVPEEPGPRAPVPAPGAPPASPAPEPPPEPEPSAPEPAVPQPPVSQPPASQSPAPEPSPSSGEPEPEPEPEPPAEPFVLRELPYDVLGEGDGPALRLVGSAPVWQRDDPSVAGREFAHGITVRGWSSVTIDLNRTCASYASWVGLDDLARGAGAAVFRVLGDDEELWRSPVLGGEDAAVPLNVPLAGVRTLRLAVEPRGPLGAAALADWAESEIRC